MSDYWSNFNSWDNNVEILPEAEHGFRAEHTFVTEGNSKYITHGKSVYSTHGANWTYQDGDVTWYQIGNLGYKQIGVSNTVIEGWNFFTVLGMNINTTVGMGMDSYFGLRVGIHASHPFGFVDITMANGVRISRGSYYEIDATDRWTTAAQKREIAFVDQKFATKMTAVVEGKITNIAGQITTITAGMASEKATLKEITCATSCTLSAPAVTLNGPGSLTAKTAGIMYFEAGNFGVIATASASIQAKGILKLQ